MKPAKGVHLVVQRAALESSTGILARAEDSVIVLRRWRDHWLIGTTDTPWNGSRSVPVAEDADIEYLLRNSNKYLARPLSRADVVATYAGLRPLLTAVGKDTGATSALSRDHAVMPGPDGLVTIVGGKYTTYRAMAADTVDAAVRQAGLTAPETGTASLPLVGATRWQATRHSGPRLAAEFGVAPARITALLGRYGELTREVLESADKDPRLLAEVAGTGHLAAEFRYAVTHELAMTLDDVLARRTHVAIEQQAAGSAAVEPVARIIAEPLGWDEDEIGRQVRDYYSVRQAEGGRPYGSTPNGDTGTAA
jgi:glycerol-3-phosphate dehydrogenase